MTELEKVTHTLIPFEVSLIKVDPCQGRGAELYGHVRIYASANIRDGSQYLSTEAQDLGSLAPVSFQWPGMCHICNAAYKPPIPSSVSETERFRGSEASDQGTLDERTQRES